jgi:vanillate/3-O-methylgallate O-demethylase
MPIPTIKDLRNRPFFNGSAAWGQHEYTNWIDESMSWKTTCYVGDWSWLADLRLEGRDALRVLSDLSVNTFAKFAVGQAKHVIQCNGDGKIIAQGVCLRTGENEFHLQWTPALWTDYKLRTGGYDATAEYVDTTNFQVSGPNALFVLEKLCRSNALRDVRFMHSTTIPIAGHDVIALRQGMAGEIGFELQADGKYYREILDAILEAGREFGIRRMGGRVGMTNHLEAFYPTTGFEYMPAIFSEDMQDLWDEIRGTGEHRDERRLASTVRGIWAWLEPGLSIGGSFESDDIRDWYRDPVELGWGNRVKFDHEFIGRQALEEIVAHPRRTSVTLVWNSDDVKDVYASLFEEGDLYDQMDLPRNWQWRMRADSVMKDGKLVGIATSRGYSVYFRQMLSLCVIDVEHATPGTRVTVIWGSPGGRQKEIRAAVAPVPYKTDRSRVDLHAQPSRL